ncbi:MAG: hypothetical protein U0840_11480 [Gemmataceae bacterium]
MRQGLLLLTLTLLAGCRSSVCHPGAESGPVALGGNNAVGVYSPAQQPVDSNPWNITGVFRLRPRTMLTHLGLRPKGAAEGLFRIWAQGLGVPLETVEQVTLVCTSGEVRLVSVVTTREVDVTAVKKACDGLDVAVRPDRRGFSCCQPPLPLPNERFWKQIEALGEHDVVVWLDRAALAQFDETGVSLKQGLRSATMTIDLGETTAVSARLNFEDEASAERGAKSANALLKLGRAFLVQVTAQADLVDAFPESVANGASAEDIALIKAQYRLFKNVEPALQACQVVARGTMVPVYLQMQMEPGKIGDMIALATKAGQGDMDKDIDISPGLFFGPRSTPKPQAVAVASTPLPVAPLQPAMLPSPTVPPPPGLVPVQGVTGVQAPPVPPPPPPMVLTPLPPPPPAPVPLQPPAAPRTLTIANVHREPVSIFAVDATGLRFLKAVPAGEAIDLPVLPGSRLAATFSRAPHCSNHQTTGSPGEIWLLRSSTEVEQRADPLSGQAR